MGSSSADLLLDSRPVDMCFVAAQNPRTQAPSSKDSVPDLSLEACLPTLEEALRYVARRFRLPQADIEELRGEVHVRLIERKALDTFQHRSSLRTYLTTAVHHTLMDLRDKRWQKWRPSMEAKRLGPTAVRMEELLVRDGYDFDQACLFLRSNCGVAENDQQLASLHQRLPHRVRRRVMGEEGMESLPADSRADSRVTESEQAAEASRLGSALEEALALLEPEDRLVLKMRYYDGLKVSEIARLLGKDQRLLYRSMERLLTRLRADLAARGFASSELIEILGELPAEIPAVLGSRSEQPGEGTA
jgi:RNA polymerase sigma factor (sigma-70 family)